MNLNKILKKRITRREFIKKLSIFLVGTGFIFYSSRFFGDNWKKRGIKKDAVLWKWSKEAYNYIKLGSNAQCLLCPNRCILENGERGFCRVRINKNGKIYTLVYGNPCAVHIDPVEKKPLFHFLPTTKVFSIATSGCNFRCLNCQNWEISQSFPEDVRFVELMPKMVVVNAIKNGCRSIAYTYSEPTIFYEYMLDTSKIARRNSIKNLWITNGYINEKPLNELCKYIDAANVDLKSFTNTIYNELNTGTLEPVLKTLKVLKENGIWFEITNLIVPTYTDNIEMIGDMVRWIKRNLGTNYPIHFSRFFPEYKLLHLPPTPISFLEKARKVAMDVGLNFVYIGNIPGHEAQNTYCPHCGKIVIERNGYVILKNNLQNGFCKFCGESIEGVWN